MKIVRWLPSLILSCSALAHADGVSDLKRFLSSTAGVQGQFNQVVSGKPGSPTQISNGDFAIQRPGKFRWNYRKPSSATASGSGSTTRNCVRQRPNSSRRRSKQPCGAARRRQCARQDLHPQPRQSRRTVVG
nr:outer-membrane lipoprotein carrier protein LolA [Jeongeupia sp. USM3]